MNRRAKSAFGWGLLVALVASLALSASASAAPAWRFNGEELKGTETILGAAIDSSLTIPGLVTKCENFLYKLTIENSSGTGKGSVTELPLYNCTTNSKACTVSSITPEGLPWPAKLTTVSSKNYIVIEKISVGIVYTGGTCAVKGLLIKVTGTAGGLIDNTTETATFDATSFKETKTKLEAMENSIEWLGIFPTEAFEWHREQAISVS